MRALALVVVFLSQLASASTTFSEDEIKAAAQALMTGNECEVLLGGLIRMNNVHAMAAELLVGKALNRDMERPDVLVPEYSDLERLTLTVLLISPVGKRFIDKNIQLDAEVLGHYINGKRVPADPKVIEEALNDFDQLVRLEHRLTAKMDELRLSQRQSPGYVYDNPDDPNSFVEYGTGMMRARESVVVPRQVPLIGYELNRYDPPTGADNGLRSPRSHLDQLSIPPTSTASGTSEIKPTREIYFDSRGHRRRMPPVGRHEN